jgi:hypothetical protein
VNLLLALSLGLEGGLVLGKAAAEGTSELGAEVKRKVLLVLVEEAELGALVGVDDGENASDRLANVVAGKINYQYWFGLVRIVRVKFMRRFLP